MLYIDEVRELPSGDGVKLFFVKSRTAGEHFVQYRTGSSYTDASGKRHNQRVTIGKTGRRPSFTPMRPISPSCTRSRPAARS